MLLGLLYATVVLDLALHNCGPCHGLQNMEDSCTQPGGNRVKKHDLQVFCLDGLGGCHDGP